VLEVAAGAAGDIEQRRGARNTLPDDLMNLLGLARVVLRAEDEVVEIRRGRV
jgi:hypothetical protein